MDATADPASSSRDQAPTSVPAGGSASSDVADALGRSAARLREEAMRVLRGFGLVSVAWSGLLMLAAPHVDHPSIAWAAVGVHAAWALAATVVRHDRAWWAGWFVVAVGLEVAAPLAGTDGWSITGGAIIMVLVGVALSGRRSWVIATVCAISAVALARGLLAPDWSLANGIATALLVSFGGLGMTWLVRRIVVVVTERDLLQAQLLAAETAAARATERAEAGARLHDTVLQQLTAVAHAPDLDDARRHAGRASNQLRQFLRTDQPGEGSLRTLVQEAVTTAADGVDVSVSVTGDRAPDDRDRLLVAALAEAVRNAARHATPPVRVLAELTPDGSARVWVADHGPGFTLDDVPDDRLGVRDSIIARLERAGGQATLHGGADAQQAGSGDGGPGHAADGRSGSEQPANGGSGAEWELVLPPRPVPGSRHDPP